jgi:hypothetical protein
MATYIELRKEAFNRTLDAQKNAGVSHLYAGVRRPLRGIEAKEDTYALMKVVTNAGKEIPLIDSSGTPRFLKDKDYYSVRPYSNFVIQQLQETRTEKAQIVETFGEPFVFFFGERVRTINFAGFLLNTMDFDWKTEWWANYDKYLRGTALVENNARLYLFYDNIILEGYLMTSTTNDNVASPYVVNFQASMLITKYLHINVPGDGKFPNKSLIRADPRARALSLGQQQPYDVPYESTRLLPVRGNISDNYDEFIGGSSYWSSELFGEEADFNLMDPYEVEAQVAELLTTLGFSDTTVGNVAQNGEGFTKTDASQNPYDD